ILKKVLQAAAPCGVEPHFSSSVHQHFMDQNKRCETLLTWQPQELGQQVFSRCALTLLIPPFGMEQLQSLGACNLPRHNAAGMLKPSDAAIWVGDFHPFL